MALLSQTKRKDKYGFDPRNTNWANDDNKFGQKLMEKMGWEKGKGLGANEDGMRDCIKAAYKQDTKGLGLTPKQADAWIAHQDDFNDLLKKLNGDSTVEPEEQGSKRFYGRFARGRVQTLRSTEDLDCILGRRKTSEPSTPATQSAANSDEEGGMKTITSSCSVQEYFANKMKAMKSRNAVNDSVDGEKSEETLQTKVDSASGKGDKNDDDTKSTPVYGAVNFSYGGEEASSNADVQTGRGWYSGNDWTTKKACDKDTKDREEEGKRKKRKRKADKEEENSIHKSDEQAEVGKGKKKKLKLDDEFCDKSQTDEREFEDVVDILESEKGSKKKKSKSKKNKGEEGQCEISSHLEIKTELPDAEAVTSSGNLKSDSCLKKKKKKNKRKQEDIDDECDSFSLTEIKREITETADGVISEDILESESCSKVKKAKKSKRKEKDIESCKVQEENSDDYNVNEKRETKKSKKNTTKHQEEVTEDCIPENIDIKSKKRKRKNEDIEEGNEDESSERRKDKKKRKKEACLNDPEEKVPSEQETNAEPKLKSSKFKKDDNKMVLNKLKIKEKKKRKKQKKALNDCFPGSNFGELPGYVHMFEYQPKEECS